MDTKSILKRILLWIECVAWVCELIFGIVWGFSLLIGELQSPGSVSLSSIILYVALFYGTMKCLTYSIMVTYSSLD